ATLRDRWLSFTPVEIVADLRTYVPIFNALTADDDTWRSSLTDDPEINDAVARLYRMPAPASIFPFVFRLVGEFKKGGISGDWVTKNLLQIEAFLVRRAVAGFEPTG